MKRGFTLVELSIVLVIIGLLIGGILVGQSMIATSNIVKMVRNISQYEIAINNFKMNFKYYPGDDPFFDPPGDGDGLLVYTNACSTTTPTESANEQYQVFTHLSQSGMLSAKYIPFSPNTFCGGPMVNGYYGANVPGIVAPYIQLNATAGSFMGEARYSLMGERTTIGSNFWMPLVFNPYDVVPMENKLGSQPNVVTSVGLVNDNGPGNCWNTAFQAVSCESSAAQVGAMGYYLNPL